MNVLRHAMWQIVHKCLEAIKSCLTSISSARLAATTHEDERLSKNSHGRLFEGPITMRYTHACRCFSASKKYQYRRMRMMIGEGDQLSPLIVRTVMTAAKLIDNRYCTVL